MRLRCKRFVRVIKYPPCFGKFASEKVSQICVIEGGEGSGGRAGVVEVDAEANPPVLTKLNEIRQCSQPKAAVAPAKRAAEGATPVQQPNGETHYLCPAPKCGKTYNSTGALRRHYRSVHLQERKFVCHFCGKAFARGSILAAL